MVKAIKANQLADQIRDYVAQWTSSDLRGYLFSVTRVTLTLNMERATVWIDVLNPAEKGKVIGRLRKLQRSYDTKLLRALQRRTVPSLEFELDRQAEMEERISDLLK